MNIIVPVKGRRKFLADFKSMSEVCEKGFEVQGYSAQKLSSGDDESLVCEISDPTGKKVVSLNLLISDTSEYPNDHTFFGFSQDESIQPHIQSIIEGLADAGSRTIEDTISRLLASIAKKTAVANSRSSMDDDEDIEEEGEDDDYDEQFDDDYDMIETTNTRKFNVQSMQRDFNEVVAAGYRPGLIRLSADEFVLSVSIPVVSLAQDIPARALMAWDPRLLSRTQYFTLMISGLRSAYPVLQSDGILLSSTKLQFRIGLTQRYKPTKEQVLELTRMFGLKEVSGDAPEELVVPPLDTFNDDLSFDSYEPVAPDPEVEAEAAAKVEEEKAKKFHFSLSTSLESLMQERFLGAVQLRLKYNLGWAGAEVLLAESHRLQRKPEDIFQDMTKILRKADLEERELSHTYNLPADPILERERADYLNLPLLAFSYLLRRLTLCPRYCLICYNRLNVDFETLKPYVCDNKLCTYQYYNLNRGPSLEYEICSKPETVDLLVSLAFCAAAEQSLHEPLPVGMGLMVPQPYQPPDTPLVEFDNLSHKDMCKAIVDLLNSLPSIGEMKNHLEKRSTAGRAKLKLQEIDTEVLPAAWSLLRWCVASCTAHLEELTSDEDRIRNIDRQWRQFRFSVGAPDAEAKFQKAQKEAQMKNSNARGYPSLYAFHGSPTKNWHSIVRHGLWYKTVANGRAYGDGVYFAKDGSISMTMYTRGGAMRWRSSDLHVGGCVALAEIVNLPSEFKSSSPYFVVQQTEWIVCRYLLVNGAVDDLNYQAKSMEVDVPFVTLDPKHPLTLSNNKILIPEPSYRLGRLVAARQIEFVEEDFDEEDNSIFAGDDHTPVGSQQQDEFDDGSEAGASQLQVVKDTWTHDADWVESCMPHLLPPPIDANPMATMAVQRELSSMLKEQASARSLSELGWYMPPEMIGDNLFQWIVEVHSFEEKLPIAQDMKKQDINSLVFEVRFPSDFPHNPPFFRILKPRFLPFINGGGGHITGGGSMCMDLLTSSGWLPSYSIPAIILQIKLAISNLEPRPARLDSNWDMPYTMHEAVTGFRRASATHGWRIPPGLDRMI